MEQTIIGFNVRRLREERVWSRAELAEAAGVHRSTIHRIEMGKNTDVRPVILRGLAKAFGLPAKHLFLPPHPVAKKKATR